MTLWPSATTMSCWRCAETKLSDYCQEDLPAVWTRPGGWDWSRPPLMLNGNLAWPVVVFRTRSLTGLTAPRRSMNGEG